MSGNPWVRGAGGSRPEPEPTDEPDQPAGPPTGGFSGVQLPVRPQSFDRGSGRRGGGAGRGGPLGFLSKLPGGGPPLPVVIVVAVVVVLAIVGGIAYAVLGGSSSPTTAPTPTPSVPTTPVPSTPTGPSSAASSPAPSSAASTAPTRPTRPANATTVPAVGGWFVPASKWGATAQTAADERSQPGSRERAYPAGGSPQAHYWVRAKSEDALAWAIDVQKAYAQQYPGLRLTRRGVFTCPAGFTTCYQIAYAYTANGIPTIGSFTTYGRSGRATMGIDFGSSVSASARANADALAMTTSLVSSL